MVASKCIMLRRRPGSLGNYKEQEIEVKIHVCVTCCGFCKTHEGGENTLQLISLLLVTAEERYTS